MKPGCVGSTCTVVEPRTGGGDGQISANVLPACRHKPRVGSGWSVDPLDNAPPLTEPIPRTPLPIGTSRLPALSSAIRPIERWKNTSLPGTSDHVSPPSVVL